MKTQLAITALLAFALTGGKAAEIKTTDGKTFQGAVFRVVPATVQFRTIQGIMTFPLESLTPESQSQVLGKKSDAEKIVERNSMLDRAAELLKNGDSTELDRQKKIVALQDKLIASLRFRLGEGPEPGKESSQVPAIVVEKLKSNAARVHPNDPSTQVYVVKEHMAAYLKLREIPDSPIKRKAAIDHPDDYSTQLYVVETESKAQSELSGIH